MPPITPRIDQGPGGSQTQSPQGDARGPTAATAGGAPPGPAASVPLARRTAAAAAPNSEASLPPRSMSIHMTQQQDRAFIEEQARQQRQDAEFRNAAFRFRAPVSVREEPLAAYVLACESTGSLVDEATLAKLRSAHHSVETARDLLACGRGNVGRDIRESGGDSFHRWEAAQDIEAGLKMISPPVPPFIKRSAVAVMAQVGGCGYHADVTAVVHGARLQPGEQLHRVSSNHIDHGWAEVRTTKEDRPDDVILDSWCHGPAHLREHSAFARHTEAMRAQGKPPAQTRVIIDPDSGPGYLAASQSLTGHLQASLGEKFDEFKRENVASGSSIRREDLWASTPAIHSGFAAAAAQAAVKPADLAKLQEPPHPDQPNTPPTPEADPARAALRHEVRAAGVARAFGGNVWTATKVDAPRLTEASKHLREAPAQSRYRLD